MMKKKRPRSRPLDPARELFSDKVIQEVCERQKEAMGRLWPEFQLEEGTAPLVANWQARKHYPELLLGKAPNHLFLSYQFPYILWTGLLRPRPNSKAYSVGIWYRPLHYTFWSMPRVQVSGEGIHCGTHPHVNFDGSLCLFTPSPRRDDYVYLWECYCAFKKTGIWPGADEWNNYSDLVADKIMNWTVDWLFHYENWLITGEWEGGGGSPYLEPGALKIVRERAAQLEAKLAKFST
jgi:hypothetical protein